MSKNDSKLVTKVSPLIEGQVPEFVQADHPVFVRFLKQDGHCEGASVFILRKAFYD